MNQDLGLRILSAIMNWDDGKATKEFEWLKMMARLKYDGYRDFLAGVRFIESLANWLQQFEQEDRETAYQLIRNKLIYVSPLEKRRLVELFYPSFVEPNIIDIVATELKIPKYKIWSTEHSIEQFNVLKRKTLFMGLSDGAGIDTLRHTNVGILTNEQIVIATQLDSDKWIDLLDNLQNDLCDKESRFELVYLIDDFLGTGTSFLRYHSDQKKWKGKLIRFQKTIKTATDAMDGQHPFSSNWKLCVHHYIAAHKGCKDVMKREKTIRENNSSDYILPIVNFTYGLTLPEDLPINSNSGRTEPFINLVEKYYDPKIKTKHHEVGGTDHMGLGYGGCALPLILEHNTPNNSVALLWADSKKHDYSPGSKAHAMRPLFRRRDRHT